MTTVRALLRSRAFDPGVLAPGTLGRLMSEVNHHLAHDVHRGRFMTLVYFVLEARTRTLRWVSAGHDPAMVYDPETGTCRELDTAGIPLGIEHEWAYEERSAAFATPGSLLVVGTDGIWEARSPTGEPFGKERLLTVVRAHVADDAATICAAVHAALDDHRGGRPPVDDTTLVVVKALE